MSEDNATLRPTTLAMLEALHRRIEEHAARCHWADVESLMAERNARLADVPSDDRPAALAAAKASTDRVLAVAADARLTLAGELARLQRGRVATAAYRANGV